MRELLAPKRIGIDNPYNDGGGVDAVAALVGGNALDAMTAGLKEEALEARSLDLEHKATRGPAVEGAVQSADAVGQALVGAAEVVGEVKGVVAALGGTELEDPFHDDF